MNDNGEVFTRKERGLYWDGLWLDLGVGLDYKTKNWILNNQPTFSPNHFDKVGFNFSIMKKL